MADEGLFGGIVAAMQTAERTAEIAAQSAQIQASAQQLATSAGSGFHIEPEAAATLIKSCMTSLDELNSLVGHVNTVGQAPQLGQTPAAVVVSPFTQQVATDPQGLGPAIQNLRQTLTDMIAAYHKASTNYAETEAIIQSSLPKAPKA
ncbi:MAG TPA: hypothetical protein VH333_17910 [Pseudonocardiaceae bacterium]|jgi:hypothetical protein|nr:hypothetical protein [Pseudonocardiaceae bacterium]